MRDDRIARGSPLTADETLALYGQYIAQGEIAAGNDRLAGKRVVIWQFAARELAFGDWKISDLPR